MGGSLALLLTKRIMHQDQLGASSPGLWYIIVDLLFSMQQRHLAQCCVGAALRKGLLAVQLEG